MIEKLRKRLKRKTLILTGGFELERTKFIKKLIENMDQYTHIYKPPKYITLFEYIDFIRKKSLTQLEYEMKNRFDFWYNIRFHEKWLEDNECVIVIEEPNIEKTYDMFYFLKGFIEKTDTSKKSDRCPHLILSMDNISSLQNFLFSPNHPITRDNRGRELVIKQNIDFVNISEH